MNTPISRATHRKGKRRRKQKRNLTWLVLLSLVFITAGLLYLNRGFFIQQTKESVSTTTSSQTSSTSSEETTATTSTVSEDQGVVWEKQENPVSLPILMYHAIHVMAPEEEANANLIVDPTTFESHLQALQTAGYYTVTPEEALKVLTENVLPKGKKVVWLTFDDSLWDFYSNAYPILRKYNMTATNNVITGLTAGGNTGHLTLEQLKEMKDNGMSFQGHTVNHPDLEYSSLEAQTMELQESKSFLDSQLGQETIAIAYPAGRYSTETIRLAQESGYKLGLTTNEGVASAANGLLTLNRVRVLPHYSPELLLQAMGE